MYLVIIAALVLAYSVGDLPAPAGYNPYVTIRATLFISVVVTLLGSALPVLILRQRRSSRLKALALRRLMLFLLGLPLGAFAYELIALGWRRLVENLPYVGHAILLDDILTMAPFLVPLFGSLLGLYWLDVALRGAVWDLRGYLTYNVRKLLLPLVLWFGFLGVADILERLDLPWAPAARFPFISWLGAGAAIVAIALLLPFAIRLTWGLKRLPDGPFRNELEKIARRVGLRYRNILVYPTYGGVVNAGVTGLIGSLRYIIFTDALLQRLSQEEIEAVFQHELAHIKCRHIPFYLLLSFCFVAFSVAFWTVFPETSGLRGWAAFSAFILFTGAYWGVLFGVISRRFERQADLYAAKTSSPHAVSSALEKIASLSGGRNSWSWRHSSVAKRVAFINRTAGNPEEEARFDASLRIVRRVGYALLGAALAAIALSMLAERSVTPPF